MKIRMSRTHTARPAEYESIMLNASVEIDPESETDADFRDMSVDKIGEELSAVLDDLLDTEVDRALRSEGTLIEDSHLWVFYEKD